MAGKVYSSFVFGWQFYGSIASFGAPFVSCTPPIKYITLSMWAGYCKAYNSIG